MYRYESSGLCPVSLSIRIFRQVSISVRLILSFNGIGVGIISIWFTCTLHVSVSASVISVKIERTSKNPQAACSCIGVNILMCISTGSASIGIPPWNLLESVSVKLYWFNTSKKPTFIVPPRINLLLYYHGHNAARQN